MASSLDGEGPLIIRRLFRGANVQGGGLDAHLGSASMKDGQASKRKVVQGKQVKLQLVLIATLIIALFGVGATRRAIGLLPPDQSLISRPRFTDEGPRRLCKYTGKHVTFFTAAGNGNWGDNMQPWTWAALFRDRGIPLHALSSASCDTCHHAYPWLNETTKLMISETTRDRNATSDDSLVAAFRDADVLWFGGGGLFGYPHRPLAHNSGGWQEWVIDDMGIKPVFAAVGSTANTHGANLIRAAKKLVDGAAFVSGRGSLDVTAFNMALPESLKKKGLDSIPVMPDPILSDFVTYPMQVRQSNPLQGRPICWIFRSEDKEFLQRTSSFVNSGDILYAMEGKDGNYHGLVPQANLRYYNGGTDFFGDIASSCKMMVSQRYHGVIMALRAGIPVVGLYEYHPHKVSDVMELIGEEHCQSHVTNWTGATATTLVHDCFVNFDIDRRYRRLGEIQDLFQDRLSEALKSSGVCS